MSAGLKRAVGVCLVAHLLVLSALVATILHAQPSQSIGMKVEMKQVILDEGKENQRCYDVFTRGMSGLEVRQFLCP